MIAKTISCILFDLGNVLIRVNFDNIFKYWAEKTNVNYTDIKNRFSFDEKFKLFEKGLISDQEYRNHIIKTIKINLTNDIFDNGWNAIYDGVIKSTEKVIEKLKTMFYLAALTNTNRIHYDCWKIKYADNIKYFKRIFCSHHMGLIKPDKEIYMSVCKELNLKPQQILFIDDLEENCRNAGNLGFHTLHAQKPDDISLFFSKKIF